MDELNLYPTQRPKRILHNTFDSALANAILVIFSSSFSSSPSDRAIVFSLVLMLLYISFEHLHSCDFNCVFRYFVTQEFKIKYAITLE